jgi:hypothetical protein
MDKDAAAVRLQLEGPIFKLVEDWRRSQRKIPSRNEAIRQLILQALELSSEKLQAVVGDRKSAAEEEFEDECRRAAADRGLPDA